MAKGRITKRSVDALSCPPGKDRDFLWDEALLGFGVCAFPTGRKVYVVQSRRAGRITIGQHGRLTPEQARSEARKLLGDIERGRDPLEERRAARAVRTFADVAEEFLKDHADAKRKARTASEYRRICASHILPALGRKKIADVKRADVARLHSEMSGTPFEANRTLAVVSAVWNWAATRDEVDATKNPAKIERFKEHSRERFLTTEELARLGEALRLAETDGLPYAVDETKAKSKHAPKPESRRVKLDPFAVAAVRLLILTGARLREILDAQWSHVDLERGILFLPDSKTGKKPVYLSGAAQVVLASLPRIDGNPHIIPGAKDGAARADLNRPWAAVCRAAGLDGVRLHDLRHSFASLGAGASLGLPIIGKLLGHTQSATTQRYAHLDADPIRRAVEAIGEKVADAMNATPSLDTPAPPVTSVTIKDSGAFVVTEEVTGGNSAGHQGRRSPRKAERKG